MKRMSKHNEEEWIAKTERLNASQSIEAGDEVKDVILRTGVVTRVSQHEGGDPIEDHGTVEIRLHDCGTKGKAPYPLKHNQKHFCRKRTHD